MLFWKSSSSLFDFKAYGNAFNEFQYGIYRLKNRLHKCYDERWYIETQIARCAWQRAAYLFKIIVSLGRDLSKQRANSNRETENQAEPSKLKIHSFISVALFTLRFVSHRFVPHLWVSCSQATCDRRKWKYLNAWRWWSAQRRCEYMQCTSGWLRSLCFSYVCAYVFNDSSRVCVCVVDEPHFINILMTASIFHIAFRQNIWHIDFDAHTPWFSAASFPSS